MGRTSEQPLSDGYPAYVYTTVSPLSDGYPSNVLTFGSSMLSDGGVASALTPTLMSDGFSYNVVPHIMESVVYANISNSYDATTTGNGTVDSQFNMFQLYDYLTTSVSVADIIRVKVRGVRARTSNTKDQIKINRQIFAKNADFIQVVVLEGQDDLPWRYTPNGGVVSVSFDGVGVDSHLVIRFGSFDDISVGYDEFSTVNFYSCQFNSQNFKANLVRNGTNASYVGLTNRFSNCSFETLHMDVNGFWNTNITSMGVVYRFEDSVFRYNTLSISTGDSTGSNVVFELESTWSPSPISYSGTKGRVVKVGHVIDNVWQLNSTGAVDTFEFTGSSISVDSMKYPLYGFLPDSSRYAVWSDTTGVNEYMNMDTALTGVNRIKSGAYSQSGTGATGTVPVSYSTIHPMILTAYGFIADINTMSDRGSIGAFYFGNTVNYKIPSITPNYRLSVNAFDMTVIKSDFTFNPLMLRTLTESFTVDEIRTDITFGLVALYNMTVTSTPIVVEDVGDFIVVLSKDRASGIPPFTVNFDVDVNQSSDTGPSINDLDINSYHWVITNNDSGAIEEFVTDIPQLVHTFQPVNATQQSTTTTIVNVVDYSVQCSVDTMYAPSIGGIPVTPVSEVYDSNVVRVVSGSGRLKPKLFAEREINLMRYLPSKFDGTDVQKLLKVYQTYLNDMYTKDVGHLSYSIDPIDNVDNQYRGVYTNLSNLENNKMSLVEKIYQITEHKDPMVVDKRFLSLLAQDLGYNIDMGFNYIFDVSDGSNENQIYTMENILKNIRMVIKTLPHWYKIRTTNDGVKVILYSFGLVADVAMLYHKNYTEFLYEDNVLDSKNGVRGFAPSSHFSVRVDAESSAIEQVANLSKRLEYAVRVIESIKPINAVLHGLSASINKGFINGNKIRMDIGITPRLIIKM